MGTVVSLAEHRRTRGSSRQQRAVFFFDLADPASYLAAERVDRMSTAVTWQPAATEELQHEHADRLAGRAAELQLPLVWPDRHPAPLPRAMRVAAHAAEQGRGALFALAAARLAFCGGFDVDDPEILAEAAAAAGLELGPCLEAAADERRDEAIDRAGRFLVAHGADAVPALQVGRVLFAGEGRVADASVALRYGGARRRESTV